ncbi:MAG: VOC family protein [Actinobacteria bacterium]|nr:VOC family protein [Actinomycetota bacterium]
MIDNAVPPVIGVHHLSLTVSDLDRSVPWYCDVLGFRQLGEDLHDDGRTVVLAQRTGFVLLLQEHKAHEGSTFSEFRPGLDHLSFRVPSKDALEEWRAHLTERAVEVQPVLEENYGTVLIFRDPDRIQLELFVDPADAREPA